MQNTQYDITMRTPVGNRYGSMYVEEDNGRVCGTLHILKRGNNFAGFTDKRGAMHIKGKITTLVRTFPYEGAGKISKDKINLTLFSGSEKYSISGTASKAPLR